MKPIRPGDTGPAVEDLQQRLTLLGFDLGSEGIDGCFGTKTRAAVASFRSSHELPEGDSVDFRTWAMLVDETFAMGDRSLYLKVPNFHGNDVRTLQNALNVLGFSCGETDGIFGVHTENALRQFQTNVGINPDGIAFEDTFDAIARLRHVWSSKSAAATIDPHMGLARTADVLEENTIVIVGTDPIARNIAGRMWNIAAATTDASGMVVVDSLEHTSATPDIIIGISSDTELDHEGTPTVIVKDADHLPTRIRTAMESSETEPPRIALAIEGIDRYDGTFTARAAQKIAIVLLDAVCAALE